jgi:hypothetical protein
MQEHITHYFSVTHVHSTHILTDHCSFHYSYRQPDIQHLLRITNSFTWEEMPTRDPDTGNLTKSGYIPKMQNVSAYIITLSIIFHTVQSAVRMALDHDMPFTKWYPFDASVSPIYEIALLTQVIFLP